MRTLFLTVLFSLGLAGNAAAIQWIGVADGRPVLCEGAQTGVFKLIGITFPGNSAAECSRLAAYCGSTDESITGFVARIPEQLDVYKGRTVTVRDKRGRAVWLVDDNGTVLNADIVRKGLAFAPRVGNPTHINELKEAEADARRAGAGMWGLEPRTDPALALRFKYASRTDKETVSVERDQGYSHRTSEKAIKFTRVVELTVDASTAKRRVDIVIQYQFKKATYDGSYTDDNERDLVFTVIQTQRESVLPGEVKTITIKSPDVESSRHFLSTGSRAYDYKRGEEYVGDVVLVKSGNRELFAHGDLKTVAASP